MHLTAIAAAQKARWTKVRKTAKVVLIRGKRTLSPAARKKIAAAQRARWARVRAGRRQPDTAKALQDSTIENVICTANQWKLKLDFMHSGGSNDRGFESTKPKW
jgi:hypothetical protein